MNETVEVMLRNNFQNVAEDRLGQIDKGGIFYVNSKKKVFEKVVPYVFLKGIHAHDSRGNKYAFFGECYEEKVRRLYKDNVAIETRISELSGN